MTRFAPTNDDPALIVLWLLLAVLAFGLIWTAPRVWGSKPDAGATERREAAEEGEV